MKLVGQIATGAFVLVVMFFMLIMFVRWQNGVSVFPSSNNYVVVVPGNTNTIPGAGTIQTYP